MGSFQEGDRVRVVSRPTTPKDRESNMYFSHMADLTGVVANWYSPTEVAVQVDESCLTGVVYSVHKESTRRMRSKFLDSASEGVKKQLTSEELNFGAHYVLLCRESDLERI